MLSKIKIIVMVELPEKVFIWAYERLLFGKNSAIFIIDYAWKNIQMPLFYKKSFTEWHNGSLEPRFSP